VWLGSILNTSRVAKEVEAAYFSTNHYDKTQKKKKYLPEKTVFPHMGRKKIINSAKASQHVYTKDIVAL
jgi:hypothetical protein